MKAVVFFDGREQIIMIGKNRDSRSMEQLDQRGRELVRAAAMNEAEGEQVAASPFLYTRVRSRINAERELREEGERWSNMLKVIWRAIPAMAMVAVLAVTLFLSANFGTQPAGVVSVEDLLDTQGAGVESVVFADNRSLSSDEVLATILNEDEQEASR
jgi:anti-sigma-K factor RskA